jgi:hypothetical protein
MPKKGFKKKKAYAKSCHHKVKVEGYTNTANGGWEANSNSRMAEMMKAGYKR